MFLCPFKGVLLLSKFCKQCCDLRKVLDKLLVKVNKSNKGLDFLNRCRCLPILNDLDFARAYLNSVFANYIA
jgi:hypothetical protein